MAAPISVFVGKSYALSYDGDDYLSNATANFRSGDSQGAIEIWFKTSVSGANQSIFSTADEGSSTHFMYLRINTSNVLVIDQQESVVNDIAGETTVTDGKWHHVVLSSSGTAWTLVLDGRTETLSVGAGLNTGDWFADVTLRDNVNLAVLKYNSTLIQYFTGVIGFTRIYSRPMLQPEAQTNYQRGRKASASDTTGLVFNLPTTEGTGNPVDTVGSLTMTLTGATWVEDIPKSKIRNSQVNIDDRIGERSVANFTIVDTPGSGSYVRGQPVSIFDDDRATATGSPLFGGFVDIPESVVLSPSGALLHEISCIDNHYLADKRIAAKIWSGITSASMVTELITDYLSAEGITAGTIQTGDTLTRVVANYVPVSDVIDALAGANGFVWYINSDKQLNFMDRTTNAASFTLTASNVLDNPAPRLSKANQLYRNIQWIRGGVDTTSQTENFLGDAKQQSFVVGFPIQTVPAVTENSASKTVGIRGLETGKDYYWNKGDPVIYANAAPSSNASVQIVYTGEYKTIVMARNDNAVASQATVEGIGTGQVENAIINTDLDTRVEAQEFGEAALTRWCQNAEKFQFTTRNGGLRAGQMLTVSFAAFDFTSHDMLIESVNTIANDKQLNYNVTAITGPMLGSWARLFKSFGEGRIIRLGQDEQVILMRIQNETLPLSETATVYSDSLSTGIVNRWLNSAPITRGSLDNMEHETMYLVESATATTHATRNYLWDASDTKFDFFSWA